MRRRLLGAFASALLAMAPSKTTASDFWERVRSASAQSAADALQRVQRARAALSEHRAAEALLVIGEVASGTPHEVELLIVLARAQELIGQPHEARATFARLAPRLAGTQALPETDALAAVRLALESADLPLALGVLAGRAESAERPSARAALRALEGNILQALGPDGLDRAIAAYRDALSAVPEHAPSLVGLALALHRQGHRDAALAVARRVRDPAQVEHGLLDSAQPRAERNARIAIWRQSVEDPLGAQSAWHAVLQDPGPWREHARQALLRDFTDGGPK